MSQPNEEYRDAVARVQDNLHRSLPVEYDCGCSAIGSPGLPNYCPQHARACGCRIQEGQYGYAATIRYCPLHAQAPAMLALLRDIETDNTLSCSACHDCKHTDCILRRRWYALLATLADGGAS